MIEADADKKTLTTPEKSMLAAVVVASVVTLFAPQFDIRWVAGCLVFLSVAYTASTVAYLKGRRMFAAAGFGSIVLLGAIIATFRWLLPTVSSGPPSHARGLILLFIVFWTVAPLLGIGAVGAMLRPKAGTPWVARRNRTR